jgi:hypothetical protein
LQRPAELWNAPTHSLRSRPRLDLIESAAAETCPLGSTHSSPHYPMRAILLSVCLGTAGCATTRANSESLDARPVQCGGYEDILSQADRPFAPCELQAMLRPARALPAPWAPNYSGPCQFVEIRVVVDSLGKLEPGSPRVQRTNAPAVASSVVRQLSEASYLPGRKNGRPVRSVRGFYFGSHRGSPRCER